MVIKLVAKILILHGVNYWNAGDLGITISMVRRIREEIPHSQVSMVSIFSNMLPKPRKIDVREWGAKEVEYILSYPFNTYYEAFEAPLIAIGSIVFAILYRKFRRKFYFLILGSKKNVIDHFIDADVVISKGGGFLWDKGKGIPSFILSLHQIFISTLLGKPTILYAQSIGPFKRSWIGKIVKHVLEKTSLILLREPLSLDLLGKIRGPEVKVTADEGFLLQSAKKERVMEIFVNEGINVSDYPLVGITVRHWSYPFSEDPKGKRSQYIDAIAKTVDYVIRHYNATVFFIPHLVGFWGYNDPDMINEIYEKIKAKHKTKILGTYSAEEIKGLIGESKIFIGTRMHSNIYALEECVPCITISYLPKCEGIMKMLNLEKWVIPVEKVNTKSLIAMVEELWNEKEQIKKKLCLEIPKIREKAKQNARAVKSFTREKEEVELIVEC